MVRYIITAWSAKRAGKKDGRRNYPPSNWDGTDGRYSEFEKGISVVAAGEISAVVKKWRNKETETLKELRTLVPELDTSLKRFQQQLETHRRHFGSDTAPEPPHRYGKASLILIALLFIFEGGVNIYTFRFLREPGITTVIIGLALAFLIPFAGFLTGRVLKGREKFLELAFAAVLFLAAAFLIFLVAQGRRIGIETRRLDPRIVEETFWIFLLMNALFFLLALWDGYASGYIHPSLQRAYEELRRRRRQYENRIARLKRALIRAIHDTRRTVAEVQFLSETYRMANRRARGNVREEEIPAYFKGNFRLPVQIPEEIQRYLGIQDPVGSYESDLMGNDVIKKGRELIDQIDNVLAG